MRETSKCKRRRTERGDFDRYLRGSGIDIWGDADPLEILDGEVRVWPGGSNQALVPPDETHPSYDFVFASHCLQRTEGVGLALSRWVSILRPGGHLYLVVPDYTLYEKLQWPSSFNPKHRNSFSLEVTRHQVRRRNHYHVGEDLTPMLAALGCTVVDAQIEDDGFDYCNGTADQTLGDAAAHIRIVARRRADSGGLESQPQ